MSEVPTFLQKSTGGHETKEKPSPGPALSSELPRSDPPVSDLIDHRYFVNGVAIYGVSGGLAFCPDKHGNVTIIGPISEYQANLRGGESLPGLLVADDISASNVLAESTDELLKQIPTD